MRKKIGYVAICVLAFCTLCACARSSAGEQQVTESKRYEFTSKIEKGACYLCSDNEDSPLTQFGNHANVGLVNLNTFDVMELAINRYDWDGNQIMEATGAMHTCGSTLGDIRVTGMVDPDCGFASVNFDPEDATINEGKIGQFLCQDCLNEFASSCYGGEYIPPIAVVSFEYRYLLPLNERSSWAYRKDHLVTADFDENGSIGIVAVYNPPRFREDNNDDG